MEQELVKNDLGRVNYAGEPIKRDAGNVTRKEKRLAGENVKNRFRHGGVVWSLGQRQGGNR